MSPPPGFDRRTVQPVASRYTDYATRPTEADIIVAVSITEDEISWSYLFSYIFLHLQSITVRGFVDLKTEIWIHELSPYIMLEWVDDGLTNSNI